MGADLIEILCVKQARVLLLQTVEFCWGSVEGAKQLKNCQKVIIFAVIRPVALLTDQVPMGKFC